ncbi:MAG: GerMN domain-containing protein [Syntrophomonadaceae bacterium]|nr:GerMN domain-containing protein [Syntrophomonadaceae bacterium]
MKNKFNIVLVLIAALLLTVAMTGCNKEDKKEPTNTPVKQSVTLYFGDNQAEYVVAEKRTVEITAPATAEKKGAAIVKALITGPQTKGLFATLPPETRLLSIKVKDSIAYVDFSQELISKHWGGSAGETMTIASVVNSLTEIKEINKVQFLVEGKQQDSLLGHWDTSSPIARNKDIIKQ